MLAGEKSLDYTKEAVECCEGYFYNEVRCSGPTLELLGERSISMEGPTAVKDSLDTSRYNDAVCCRVSVAQMPIFHQRVNGQVVWIRNPFTGTHTYFNNIHKKIFAFREKKPTRSLSRPRLPELHTPVSPDLVMQMAQEEARCFFCPGHEVQTTAELFRVTYGEIFPPDEIPAGMQPGEWAIRVFRNLIPRIPEACTGGRNESYVVVEDARHYTVNARSTRDLQWSGALSVKQFVALLRANVRLVHMAYANETVRSVLIRKNQGPESGGSQPHIHNQVIASNALFPDIEAEMQVTAQEPRIWAQCVDFFRQEGWIIHEEEALVTCWSPFGKFPRCFDVIDLAHWGPLTAMSDDVIERFARALHQVLVLFGPSALDYEVHQGEGIPLHVHVNSRQFTYSNIGGTLNLPNDLTDKVQAIRQTLQGLAL
jgi:galactose-1-phosphate uridylyltransferase